MIVSGTASPGAFEGGFDIHVAVGCDEAGLVRLRRWAEDRGVTLTRILLDRDRLCRQSLLTLAGSGTLGEQREAAGELVERLRADGFATRRVKIEAAPWNAGVPRDTGAALRLGSGYYFEHHVKLVLADGGDLGALARVLAPHGARVSWKGDRVPGTGHHHRFVTQHCRAVGSVEAGARLEELCRALRERGYMTVSAQQEFVVFDSGAGADGGRARELDAYR